MWERVRTWRLKPATKIEWYRDEFDRRLDRMCRAMLPLVLGEDEWIHRRVETINLLSRESVRRSVSVDFTLPDWASEDLRGPGGGLIVPIALLRKRSLRKFDIRAANRSVPVLGREHNSLIAVALLEHVALDALKSRKVAEDWSGLDTELELVRKIADGDLGESKSAWLELRSMEESGHRVAVALADSDEFVYMVSALRDNYLLCATLPGDQGRRVISYGSDERLLLEETTSGLRRFWYWLLETCGQNPVVLSMDVPSAIHTASYHAEIVIPDELRIEAAFLNDATLPDGADRLSADMDSNRGSLHVAGLSANADPYVMVGIRPERSGFPIAAACFSAVYTAFLVLGTKLIDFESLVGTNSTSQSISVLFAISSLAAGVVARGGEHQLVKTIFWGPRLLVVLVGLCGLFAAGALAIRAPSESLYWIWTTCSLLSTLCSTLLFTFALRAAPLRADPDTIRFIDG